MSREDESGQEATQQPGERRLRQARTRGQIPRSRELVVACQMLLVGLSLPWLVSIVSEATASMGIAAFAFDHADATDESRMLLRLAAVGQALVGAVAPLFCVITGAGVLGSVAVGGFLFSVDIVRPRAERLSPGRGLRRLLSRQGLALLIKASLKTALLMLVLWWFLSHHLPTILTSAMTSPPPAVYTLRTLLTAAMVLLSLVIVVVAALDVPWQMYSHQQRMLVTHQQARETARDEEGGSLTRDRIRRLRTALGRRRMLQDVAQADLVITNPDHIAVALGYGPDIRSHQDSPVVLAKGADLLAEKIVQIARTAGKPLVCQPPLARALFHHVEVGQPIPEDLYTATARVMAYVYLLNSYRAGQRQRPPVMQDIFIPAAYRRRRGEVQE